MFMMKSQPPSGGCVLKLPQWKILNETAHPAAFRRLCVETLITLPRRLVLNTQPPSGGCVLKRISNHSSIFYNYPAAFRRLCVETEIYDAPQMKMEPSRLQAAVC